MKTTRIASTLVLAISGLIGGTVTAEAADYNHVDRLAVRLQGQSRALLAHLRVSFRHAPEFGHLMHDANELAAAAAHVHEVAHHEDVSRHLAVDLGRLDKSFHHLTELLDDIDRHVSYCNDPRCGHFHGSTRAVRVLLARIDDTLHHMRDDVRRVVVRNNYGHGNGYATGHGYAPGHGTLSGRVGNRGSVRGYRPTGHDGYRSTNVYRQSSGRGHGERSAGITLGRRGFSLRLGF